MSTKETGVWVCVGQEVPGTAYEQIYFGRMVPPPMIVENSDDLRKNLYSVAGQFVTISKPPGTTYPCGAQSVELEECQLCVAVATSIRSWFELATKGPNEACRVSSPVKSAVIGRVREIIECTEQAVQAWHSCPWGKVPLQQQPIQMAS